MTEVFESPMRKKLREQRDKIEAEQQEIERKFAALALEEASVLEEEKAVMENPIIRDYFQRLTAKEAELDARAAKSDAREAQLDERMAQLAEREAQLAERMAQHDGESKTDNEVKGESKAAAESESKSDSDSADSDSDSDSADSESDSYSVKKVAAVAAAATAKEAKEAAVAAAATAKEAKKAADAVKAKELARLKAAYEAHEPNDPPKGTQIAPGCYVGCLGPSSHLFTTMSEQYIREHYEGDELEKVLTEFRRVKNYNCAKSIYYKYKTKGNLDGVQYSSISSDYNGVTTKNSITWQAQLSKATSHNNKSHHIGTYWYEKQAALVHDDTDLRKDEHTNRGRLSNRDNFKNDFPTPPFPIKPVEKPSVRRNARLAREAEDA